MDVPGNARAFPLHSALALDLHEPVMDAAASYPYYAYAQHACRRHGGKGAEPPGLPLLRQNRERQSRAGFVPHIVIVAGLDAESVIGRGQITVLGNPFDSGICPFLL